MLLFSFHNISSAQAQKKMVLVDEHSYSSHFWLLLLEKRCSQDSSTLY